MAIAMSSCVMYQSFEMNGGNEFENEDIKVTHKFWCPGGNSGFLVYNKTDKPIYIDLSHTHSIINSEAITFYQQRTKSFSLAHQVAAKSSGIFKSLNSSSNETVTQQRVNEIPPHSYKGFSGYTICDTIYREKGFDEKRRGNVKFSERNTPVEVRNMISYSFDGENEKVFETSTWVKSIEINKSPVFKQHGFYVVVYKR